MRSEEEIRKLLNTCNECEMALNNSSTAYQQKYEQTQDAYYLGLKVECMAQSKENKLRAEILEWVLNEQKGQKDDKR